jgi:hypothetical protein
MSNAKVNFVLPCESEEAETFKEITHETRVPLMKVKRERFNKMFIEYQVLIDMLSQLPKQTPSKKTVQFQLKTASSPKV